MLKQPGGVVNPVTLFTRRSGDIVKVTALEAEVISAVAMVEAPGRHPSLPPLSFSGLTGGSFSTLCDGTRWSDQVGP